MLAVKVARLGDGARGQIGCQVFNLAAVLISSISLGGVALASRNKQAAVLLLVLRVVLERAGATILIAVAFHRWIATL